MKIRELFEAEETHVTFCFGRLNPPTRGHEHLFNVMESVGGDYKIFLTQTQDRKENPLDYETKIKFVKTMFPDHADHVIEDRNLNTIVKVASYLYDQGYKNCTFVAGDDRLEQLGKVLKDYNGAEGKAHGFYKFDLIDLKSSGKREEGSDGVEGIKAGNARLYAASGDLEKFKEVTGAGEQADELYAAVRNGLGVKNTSESSYKKIKKQRLRELFEPTIDYVKLNDGSYVQIQYRPLPNTEPVPGSVQISKADPKIIPDPNTVRLIGSAKLWQQQAIAKAVAAGQLKEIGGDWQMKSDGLTTEKQILTRIRQIMYDRKLSGTESNAGELMRLKQQLKDLRSQQGVSEGDLEEDWRKKLAAAGMAGMMAVSGAAGAADRVPDTAKEPIIATIVIDGEARRLDLTPLGFKDVKEAESYIRKFMTDRGIKKWEGEIERSTPGTGRYERLAIADINDGGKLEFPKRSAGQQLPRTNVRDLDSVQRYERDRAFGRFTGTYGEWLKKNPDKAESLDKRIAKGMEDRRSATSEDIRKVKRMI